MPREFEWKCVPIIAQTLFQTLRIVPSLYANQQWHVTKMNVSGNMNQFQIPRCVAELVAAFELFKCRWGNESITPDFVQAESNTKYGNPADRYHSPISKILQVSALTSINSTY